MNFGIDKYIDNNTDIKNKNRKIIEEKVENKMKHFFLDNKNEFIDLIKLDFINKHPDVNKELIEKLIYTRLIIIFNKSFSEPSYELDKISWKYNKKRLSYDLYDPYNLFKYNELYYNGNKIKFIGEFIFKKFKLNTIHSFYYNKNKEKITVQNYIWVKPYDNTNLEFCDPSFRIDLN